MLHQFQTLFYLSFLKTEKRDGQLPSELLGDDIMTPGWKKKAREAIVCRKSATTTSHVLPQYSDIELVFKGAIVFNYNSYWVRTLTADLRSVPCNESVGFNEDGSLLMCREHDVQERKSIINRLNSKCGCGQKSTTSCCKSNRCSCQKNYKKCEYRCSYMR